MQPLRSHGRACTRWSRWWCAVIIVAFDLIDGIFFSLLPLLLCIYMRSFCVHLFSSQLRSMHLCFTFVCYALVFVLVFFACVCGMFTVNGCLFGCYLIILVTQSLSLFLCSCNFFSTRPRFFLFVVYTARSRCIWLFIVVSAQQLVSCEYIISSEIIHFRHLIDPNWTLLTRLLKAHLRNCFLLFLKNGFLRM